MDWKKIANRAQIYKFYKEVKIKNIFIFQATVLKFGDLSGGGVEVGNKCKISAQYLQKLHQPGQYG